MELRFYYDVVCPYAYLASTRVEAVAERAGATLRWVPVLLGGLYKHVEGSQNPAAEMSAPKARLNLLDMQRWAHHLGVPLRIPGHHPRRSVDAMRLLVGADEAKRAPLTRALYRAYWVEGLDVADRAVLDRIATAHGVDPAVIDSTEARQGLFDTTAEAAGHGAFGVPGYLVAGEHFYWGQDRLHFVEAALGGEPAHVAPAGGPAQAPLRLYHDFSSPWSYLASTQVERFAREQQAELEWAPILLGGLFREIGTPNVPMHAMNAAKQRYTARDLKHWADWWGVELNWPSHFPLRTVTPLRAALVEPALTRSIYRAAWVDDRDIGDAEVLAAVIAEAGFDAERVLAGTTDPEIKAKLRANTEAAKAAGACGVPTFEVQSADAPPMVFWGQDRLELVARALHGWRPPCG